MAYVIPGAQLSTLQASKAIGSGRDPQHRLVLDAREEEALRADAVGFLYGIGISIPKGTTNADVTFLQVDDGGLDPIPGTDCYRTTCYDLYCCPLVLIPFPCIVCDEASLSQFAVRSPQ